MNCIIKVQVQWQQCVEYLQWYQWSVNPSKSTFPKNLLPRFPNKSDKARDWRVPVEAPSQFWLLHVGNAFEIKDVNGKFRDQNTCCHLLIPVVQQLMWLYDYITSKSIFLWHSNTVWLLCTSPKWMWTHVQNWLYTYIMLILIH